MCTLRRFDSLAVVWGSQAFVVRKNRHLAHGLFVVQIVHIVAFQSPVMGLLVVQTVARVFLPMAGLSRANQTAHCM